MEHEAKSSRELPEWQTMPVTEFKPSPEHLQELPPQTFNVEQMESGQIAALVMALEAGIDLEERPERSHIRDSEGERDGIDELISLLERDLTCLPARNFEKAREVIFALAAHKHYFVRAVASDAISSLFRFQPVDDYLARQQVIDVWVGLLQDEDEVAREGAEASMSQTVDSDWIDEPTARYLDSKLPPEWQREDWWT
ncbi:hypothetical protein [Streptomyces scabiei]|uniref:hypothetical protein n=1 Tax=Streptomyces scabiei TaxID=1930 RepID=UPI00117E76F5|nr:hypothetical protein [Streptomyces scabiei]